MPEKGCWYSVDFIMMYAGVSVSARTCVHCEGEEAASRLQGPPFHHLCGQSCLSSTAHCDYRQ